MKSFAILAVAGAVAAQEALGDCAQLCVNNMARIAQGPPYSCGEGDTNCFCTKSNWAYGLRDCSNEACDATQAAQAVAYGYAQCAGVEVSGSAPPAAVPILTSAIASAIGPDGSPIASITGSLASEAQSAAQSAVTVVPIVGTVTNSDGSVVVTTSGFSTVFASVTESAAGAVSSITGSLGSELASATNSVGDLLSSITDSAGSVVESATSALESGASAAESAASSAASDAAGAAPIQTAAPVMVAAGAFAAMFL